MPSRITIACTHCGAKLNLTDESKLGKKFKCPKCSEVFVAESADDEEVLEMDEAGEDEGDDEDERPRSRRAAAAGASAKGGKKGKAAKAGGNTGLIVGGIAGGVVLLGGLAGVLFATGVFGGTKADPNQIQVSPAGAGMFSSLLKEQGPTPVPARTAIPEVAKWLPAETEFVIHVRPADVMASPLVGDLLKSMQLDQQVNAATQGLGFQISDIESVTFGVAQLEKAQQQMQQAQMAMMMGGKPQFGGLGTPAIGVIKLKKSITYDDLTKLAAQLASDQPVQKVSHAGKEYLEATDPKTSVKGGAYLAGNSIILMGDSTALKAAIDKGANGKPLPNFGFVDWTDHLTIAFAPQKPGALKQQLTSGGQANPMIALAMAPVAEGATGFCLGLTVKGGVEAEVAVGCLDAPKMDAIAKSLNDLSSLGRSQYDQSKSKLPPWASALTDMLMGNLKVTSSNRVVMLSTNIPDSARDQLVQVPANIMATMAMAQMLGPGANQGAPTVQTTPSDSNGDAGGGGRTKVHSVFEEAVEISTRPLDDHDDIEIYGTLSIDEVSPDGTPLSLILNVRGLWIGPIGTCELAAIGRLKDGSVLVSDNRKIDLTAKDVIRSQPASDTLWPILLMDGYEPGAIFGNYNLPVGARDAPMLTISGSCTMLTGKPIQVEVKDFNRLVAKDYDDVALTEAELTVSTEKADDAQTEEYLVTVKEGYLLSKIVLTQGRSVQFASEGENERTQRLGIPKNSQSQTDGLQVHFFLFRDVKTIEVPFTFENVPLPKKPEK